MNTTIYRTIKGSEIEKMFDSSFDEFSIRYYNATDLYDSDIYDNNNKYKFEIKIRHDEGTIANMIFDKEYMEIETLEGVMKANIGDYIIKGVNGEFYPCKPDIFEKTYEEAE